MELNLDLREAQLVIWSMRSDQRDDAACTSEHILDKKPASIVSSILT
jgi:hypothetical protein